MQVDKNVATRTSLKGKNESNGVALTMANEYDTLVRNFAWDIPQVYNLGAAVSDCQVKLGRETAIVSVDKEGKERRYTFKYLSDNSNRMANLLVRDGFKRGDRIGVMLPASVEAAVCHLAILKAGLISVPLDYNGPASTAQGQIRFVEASGLITTMDLAESFTSQSSAASHPPKIYSMLNPQTAPEASDLERMLSSSRAQFTVPPTLPDDPALLAFTSGSEGAPKAVLHAHRVVLGILPAVLFSGSPQPGDLTWSHFSWGALGGFLVALGGWHCGTAVVLDNQQTLVPNRTIELLRRLDVRHVSIAPTALKMIRYGAKSVKFPRLSSITSGGEKLDPESREWVLSSFGIELSEVYGLSECGGVLGSGNILPTRSGAIGKPAPGQSVQIISAEGDCVANHTTGFIGIGSPHPAMFLGYWNDEASTRSRFVGPFLNTGDLGFQDDDGYIWYSSRADDIISVAGHRISPAEIEEAILASEAVKLCAAVGLPDALSGEAIVAWVQLNDGWAASSETEGAIYSAIRPRLNSYQLPRRIRFVPDMPLTVTGKVNRRMVREHEFKLR